MTDGTRLAGNAPVLTLADVRRLARRHASAAESPETWTALDAALVAWDAERQRLAAALDAAAANNHTRRWNMREVEGGLEVCIGDHGRAEDCKWVKFVPAAGSASEDAALARIAQIIGLSSCGFCRQVRIEVLDPHFAAARARRSTSEGA